MAAEAGLMQVFQGGVSIGRLFGRVNGPLTAHASGGQASAVPLKSAVNYIGTVGTAADSVKLPNAAGGRIVIVVNGGAAAAQVFSKETTVTTINGTAGSTGVSLGNGHMAIFVCVSSGVWVSWGGAYAL